MSHDEQLSALSKNITNNGQYLSTITVKTSQSLVLIDAGDLDYLVSKDHYTCIFSNGTEFLSSTSVQRFEDSLDPTHFARIHRNAIVRINAIKQISSGVRPIVTLVSGAKIEASRRLAARLKNRLKQVF